MKETLALLLVFDWCCFFHINEDDKQHDEYETK